MDCITTGIVAATVVHLTHKLLLERALDVLNKSTPVICLDQLEIVFLLGTKVDNRCSVLVVTDFWHDVHSC
jgi:hypothetical protein